MQRAHAQRGGDALDSALRGAPDGQRQDDARAFPILRRAGEQGNAGVVRVVEIRQKARRKLRREALIGHHDGSRVDLGKPARDVGRAELD